MEEKAKAIKAITELFRNWLASEEGQDAVDGAIKKRDASAKRLEEVHQLPNWARKEWTRPIC